MGTCHKLHHVDILHRHSLSHFRLNTWLLRAEIETDYSFVIKQQSHNRRIQFIEDGEYPVFTCTWADRASISDQWSRCWDIILGSRQRSCCNFSSFSSSSRSSSSGRCNNCSSCPRYFDCCRFYYSWHNSR